MMKEKEWENKTVPIVGRKRNQILQMQEMIYLKCLSYFGFIHFDMIIWYVFYSTGVCMDSHSDSMSATTFWIQNERGNGKKNRTQLYIVQEHTSNMYNKTKNDHWHMDRKYSYFTKCKQKIWINLLYKQEKKKKKVQDYMDKQQLHALNA